MDDKEFYRRLVLKIYEDTGTSEQDMWFACNSAARALQNYKTPGEFLLPTPFPDSSDHQSTVWRAWRAQVADLSWYTGDWTKEWRAPCGCTLYCGELEIICEEVAL